MAAHVTFDHKVILVGKFRCFGINLLPLLPGSGLLERTSIDTANLAAIGLPVVIFISTILYNYAYIPLFGR